MLHNEGEVGMTIADVLIILATLAGPIIAVQVTRYVDNRREKHGRKLQIYKTLMATRAYTLAPAHVEALNLIDLEFSSHSHKEKHVVEVWKQYLDVLGDRSLTPERWAEKRMELLVDLLFVMGQCLDYKFDKTHIKNATYAPVAHGRVEEENDAIRSHTLELLQGKRTLPMFVTNFPEDAREPAISD
jgi:hypothetical protein